MAVDMVDGSADDNFDIAILVSGDGDSRILKNHCDKSLALTKEILKDFFKMKKRN